MARADYSGVPYTAQNYDAVEKEGGGWELGCWFGPKEELKKKNPLINLPYIQDGDVVVTQSNACIVYLADKCGLMGKTAQERIECEQCLCECTDLRNEMVRNFYGSACEPAMLAALLKHGSLAKLDAWLEAKGTTFLIGDEPMAPDFHLAELLDQVRNE